MESENTTSKDTKNERLRLELEKLLRLAHEYYQADQFEEARHVYNQISLIQPHNVEAHLYRAACQYRLAVNDQHQVINNYSYIMAINGYQDIIKLPYGTNILLGHAQDEINHQRFELAEFIYSVIVSRQPGNVEALLGRARTLYYAQENSQSTINAYQYIVKLPNGTNILVNHAQDEINHQRFELAEFVYSLILDHQPDNIEALLGRARIHYFKKKDFQLASKDYEYIMQLPDGINILLIAARNEHSIRTRKLAEFMYSLILDHQPDNIEALLGRASVARNQNQINAAIADYDAVLQYQPDNLEALLDKIEILYSVQGASELVINDCSYVIQLPNGIDHLLNTVNIDINPRFAELIYSLILDHQPDNIEALLGRASARANDAVNDRNGAVADYNVVLRYQPDNLEARLFLNDYEYIMQRPNGLNHLLHAAEAKIRDERNFALAAQIYSAILRNQPNNIEVLLRWAEARYKQQIEQRDLHVRQIDFARAENDFDLVLQQQPNNIKARQLRAEIRYQQGNLSDADADYDIVLQHQRDNIEALLGKAQINLASGNYVDAEKRYDTVIKQLPDECRGPAEKTIACKAFKGRADSLFYQGNDAGAETAYTTFLESFDQFPFILKDFNAIESLVNRGQSRFYQGNITHAQADYDTALQHRPGNVAALLGNAQIQLHLGNYTNAAEIYRQILIHQPTNIQAQIYLITCQKLQLQMTGSAAKQALHNFANDARANTEDLLAILHAFIYLKDADGAKNIIATLRMRQQDGTSSFSPRQTQRLTALQLKACSLNHQYRLFSMLEASKEEIPSDILIITQTPKR